jgi:hypothetical protein
MFCAIYCGTVAPFRPILGLGRSSSRTRLDNFQRQVRLDLRAIPRKANRLAHLLAENVKTQHQATATGKR